MTYPFVNWLREELVRAPLEPILHASPRRLSWAGLTFFTGHLLFGWIWDAWLPQPYESPELRIAVSALALVLMLTYINERLSEPLTHFVFFGVFWIELPLFFSWMYLCNGGNQVWLASVAAMILIYYHVTDLRLATIGIAAGGFAAWGLFNLLGMEAPSITPDQAMVNAVVIAFAWTVAILLSLSSANLRRERLSHTLTTIGIMAHELRTPLSTAALIGDAIQMEVQRQEPPRPLQLEKLALRLHSLVRNMHHQIETQIANAKLLQLPRYTERIDAGSLVLQAVSNYPYQSSRQRECVRATVHQSFIFLSSATQFSQVLDNLLKNALHSLTAANSRMAYGVLRVDVGVANGKGYISVTDEGMGVDPAMMPKLFKPFFSSDRGTGHGLGLAFCHKVVTSAGGTINARSKFAVGASFTIELPVSAARSSL
jgi:two-component system CAI-1 autoinducer sensor kinase/phosphatase CqsS